MTLRELYAETIGRLSPVYDAREARNILDLTVENIKGWSRVDILLNGDKEISDFFYNQIGRVVTRLLSNEPIQFILGETYWHGLTLKVGPGVLIPRPETSQLVDIIVDENSGSDLNVLDLCTGSGAIAIALSRSLKYAHVTAIDISPEALAIAEINNQSLKTGVKIMRGDVLSPLPFPADTFDIITANPPYICEKEKSGMKENVVDYEPSIALFVPDDDPLRFYKAISAEAFRISTEGGKLYFEINPIYGQEVERIMLHFGWQDVEIYNDMYGRARFASGQKKL